METRGFHDFHPVTMTNEANPFKSHQENSTDLNRQNVVWYDEKKGSLYKLRI